MIICTILVLLVILGIFMCYLCHLTDSPTTGLIGAIIIIISVVCLIVSINEKIEKHFTVHANINEFVVTKVTIEQARSSGIAIENAAIQHKIIECNQWLAKAQYYNSSIWGWWIPDKVDSLELIE